MAAEVEEAFHEIVEAVHELTQAVMAVARSNQAIVDAMLMAATESEGEDEQGRPAAQYLDGSAVR